MTYCDYCRRNFPSAPQFADHLQDGHNADVLLAALVELALERRQEPIFVFEVNGRLAMVGIQEPLWPEAASTA